MVPSSLLALAHYRQAVRGCQALRYLRTGLFSFRHAHRAKPCEPEERCRQRRVAALPAPLLWPCTPNGARIPSVRVSGEEHGKVLYLRIRWPARCVCGKRGATRGGRLVWRQLVFVPFPIVGWLHLVWWLLQAFEAALNAQDGAPNVGFDAHQMLAQRPQRLDDVAISLNLESLTILLRLPEHVLCLPVCLLNQLLRTVFGCLQ